MPLDYTPREKPEKSDKSDETDNETYGAVQFSRDLLRSAAYSAVAAPSEGIFQIVDQVGGTRLQSGSQHFFAHVGVEAPQADASGAKWLAQTIGSAGMAVPMLLLHKPVKALLADKGASLLSERTTLGFTLKESALTGFLQGSVLTPTQDEHFLKGRFKSGLGSSVQFVGMTAASYQINRFAENPYAVKHGFNAALTNPVITGVLSGIPGGALGAEIEAVKQGRALPTASELGESVLGMTLTGGLFGAKHLLKENRAIKASANWQSQDLLNHPEVRSLVMAPRPLVTPPDFLQSVEPASIPQATGPWRTEGGRQTAPWRLGDISRHRGATTVDDYASKVSQRFNGDGKLVEANTGPSGNSHSFVYNSSGELRAIITDPNHGWFNRRGTWSQGSINPQTGRLELFGPQANSAIVGRDGAILSNGERAWSVPLTARFHTADASGAELKNWDLASEKRVADALTGRSSVDQGNTTQPTAISPVAAELVAFRTAADKYGLKSGLGQLEAELNRSLLAGNHLEAASLLVAAQKLLPLPGVDTLQVSRVDGGLNLTAEGYFEGKHHRYLLDGTVISTGQMMRTTKYPNGVKVEDSFHSDQPTSVRYDAAERPEQFKKATKRGDFEQNIRYEGDGSIASISYSIANGKTVLSNDNGNWQTTVDLPARHGQTQNSGYTVNHGPGEVSLHVDGTAVFKPTGDGRFMLYEQDGELVINQAGKLTALTPAQSPRALRADLNEEVARRSTLCESFSSAEERSKFEAAGRAFDEGASRIGLPSDQQGILLAEVNNLIQDHPASAAKLLDSINQTLAETKAGSSKDAPQIVVEKTFEGSQIYIGNKTIQVSSAGEVSTPQPLLMRFEGITDLNFKSDLAKAAANDLSSGVARLFKDNGIVVIGSESIARAFPDLAEQRPLGWPNGTKNTALDSLYNPAEKRIAVAQTHDVYSHNVINSVRTTDPSQALLRAAGSAVNETLGKLSESEAFQQALKADSALPDTAKQQPNFYTLGSAAENSANLFADIFVGTQRPGDQTRMLRKLYPHTASLVDEVAKAIEAGQANLKAQEILRSNAPAKAQESAKGNEHPPYDPNLSPELQPGVQQLLQSAVGAKPEIPKIVSAQFHLDGSLQTAIEAAKQSNGQQTVAKRDDGSVSIVNQFEGLERIYDSRGRLVEAGVGGNLKQRYVWDENTLKAVFLPDAALIHTENGWQSAKPAQDNTILLISKADYPSYFVHPEGGLIQARESSGRVSMANGRSGMFFDDGVLIDRVDPAYEKQAFARLVERVNPPELGTEIKTMAEQFTTLAGAISENSRLAFLAEVSATLKASPEQSRFVLDTVNNWLKAGEVRSIMTERAPDGTLQVTMTGQGTQMVWSTGKTRTYANGVEHITYPDGTREQSIHEENGREKSIFAADGSLTSKEFLPYKPDSRSIERSGDTIISVTEPEGKGSYAIMKEGNDWVSTRKSEDGKVTRLVLGQGELSVDKNSIIFTPVDSRQPQLVHTNLCETWHYPDQRVERSLASGRRDYIAAEYNHELTLLNENLRKVFTSQNSAAEGLATGQQRLARFEKLLDDYRQSPTAGDPGKKALVMLQLNRLLTAGEAKLPLSDRADLAEQLLAQAIDPIKIWQGRHPTCNVTTVQHRLMVQHPDKVIALVADMTVDGSYTRSDGRAVTANTIAGGFAMDGEARTNLNRQLSADGAVLGEDGGRDWASQIVQSTLIRSAWMDKEFYLVGTHIAPEFAVSWTAVTDPNAASASPVFKAVMIDPKQLESFDPRSPDRLRIFDSKNMIIGMLPQHMAQPLRSRTGEWLTKLAAGDTAYDAWGRPLVHRAAPDEIGFGQTFMGENTLVILADGYVRPILDVDQKLPVGPQFGVDDIRNAYMSVDSDPSASANIIGFGTISNATARAVNSADQLMSVVEDMRARSQLPGILLVHTRSTPFGHWKEGGYHVVNIYEGDQAAKTIKYSNQWGSVADRMIQGISAEQLMSALRPPLKPPAMPQLLVPLPLLNASSAPQFQRYQNLTAHPLTQSQRQRAGWFDFLFSSNSQKSGH